MSSIFFLILCLTNIWFMNIIEMMFYLEISDSGIDEGGA